jgi:TRAP-type mannitol/chloroaromatic compound transport system substrate-binding protein
MGCRAATLHSLAFTESIQFDQMTENVEKNGVKQMYWSNNMLATFNNDWMEVLEEKRSTDHGFKKVWDDLAAFREGYDIWESHAFLPRAQR